MKVHDFTLKKFKDIAEHSNPAFGTEPCFMICRSDDYTENNKKYIVLEIVPNENPKENESVRRIAKFWNSIHAMAFTKAFVSQYRTP